MMTNLCGSPKHSPLLLGCTDTSDPWNPCVLSCQRRHQSNTVQCGVVDGVTRSLIMFAIGGGGKSKALRKFPMFGHSQSHNWGAKTGGGQIITGWQIKMRKKLRSV